MFSRPTLFIVGAGASKEIGLPTGSELKSLVARDLDFKFSGFDKKSGNYECYQALRKFCSRNNIGIDRATASSRALSQSMPLATSIDNYLHTHQTDLAAVAAGKIAIANQILNSEKSSKIYCYENGKECIEFSKLENVWFVSFAKLLFELNTTKQIGQVFDNLYIVSFNYDRSIEHFLFHALIKYFHIPPNQSATLMNDLKIFHPYGTLGPLPWSKTEDSLGYGQTDFIDLYQISERIKTFTERVDQKTMLDEIKDIYARAEVLVFLGFGYHPINMQLLSRKSDSPIRLLVSSTKGLSDSDMSLIPDLVYTSRDTFIARKTVIPKDSTCVDTISEAAMHLKHLEAV